MKKEFSGKFLKKMNEGLHFFVQKGVQHGINRGHVHRRAHDNYLLQKFAVLIQDSRQLDTNMNVHMLYPKTLAVKHPYPRLPYFSKDAFIMIRNTNRIMTEFTFRRARVKVHDVFLFV
jgi:hypothetical protein